MNCEKEIETLIRARTPLFFITTHEENRLNSFLKNLAEKEKMLFLSWSFAAMSENTQNTIFTKDNTLDFNDILKKIIDTDNNIITVFKDVGRIIKNQDPEVSLIRRIKEFVINYSFYTKDGRPFYKPIIFLDSSFTIPYELDKECVVLDYPLIDFQHVNDIINNFEDDKVKFADKNRLVSSLLGLTENEIINTISYLYQVKTEDSNVDLLNLVKKQKKQMIQKSEFLEYISEEETIDDVGGLNYLKEWIKMKRLAFTKEAKEYGLLKPKGVLLVGIPGCGKSLSAKAVANLWGVPLIRFDIGKLFNSLIGASEKATRTALKTIDAIGDCVIWIDEIEKGMAGIHSSSHSDAGTTARVIGTILTWLQERKDTGSFVLATANNIRALPPELLRKGRFNEIFFIGLPSIEERQEIFKIHLAKKKRDPKIFNIELLSKNSEGLVGSEIEESINAAMFIAFADNKREFTTEDINKELKYLVPISVSMKDILDDLWKWCKEGKVRWASSGKIDESVKIGFGTK